MIYGAIDLKSFYASCECVERGLDPLSTNLVVADPSRTAKTICLAVTPSLKKRGIPGRPRLFEVIRQVQTINNSRRIMAPGRKFIGATYDDVLLEANIGYELDYIVAPPRMALYMEYSQRIYSVYLKYFAPEDIHVYSIDEVFIDYSKYLTLYKLSPYELSQKVVSDVLKTTGITATVGIGTNLYLAKVAMDIMAKKITPDKNGIRIAYLDTAEYKRSLWFHQPLTDFWRVGRGYQKRLAECGMYTMGDVAMMSTQNEALLYRMFGVNAELLIDHAWGEETCTMADIKSYKPLSSSLSSGQVLSCPYDYDKTELIVREMCQLLSLDLVKKSLLTNQVTLTVGYDSDTFELFLDEDIAAAKDYYNKAVPKGARGTITLEGYTSSSDVLVEAVIKIFNTQVDRRFLSRRINVVFGNIITEKGFAAIPQQINFFLENDTSPNRLFNDRERKRQRAEIAIKSRYGKNAILRGMNLEDGATTIIRNSQIGGHKA